MTTTPRLHRLRRYAILGGVSAGLGRAFSIDPTIIRLAWVLAAFLGGVGILPIWSRG
jgi:phage shock protein PspC (stress-responsive transcriptional regulator)